MNRSSRKTKSKQGIGANGLSRTRSTRHESSSLVQIHSSNPVRSVTRSVSHAQEFTRQISTRDASSAWVSKASITSSPSRRAFNQQTDQKTSMVIEYQQPRQIATLQPRDMALSSSIHQQEQRVGGVQPPGYRSKPHQLVKRSPFTPAVVRRPTTSVALTQSIRGITTYHNSTPARLHTRTTDVRVHIGQPHNRLAVSRQPSSSRWKQQAQTPLELTHQRRAIATSTSLVPYNQTKSLYPSRGPTAHHGLIISQSQIKPRGGALYQRPPPHTIPQRTFLDGKANPFMWKAKFSKLLKMGPFKKHFYATFLIFRLHLRKWIHTNYLYAQGLYRSFIWSIPHVYVNFWVKWVTIWQLPPLPFAVLPPPFFFTPTEYKKWFFFWWRKTFQAAYWLSLPFFKFLSLFIPMDLVKLRLPKDFMYNLSPSLTLDERRQIQQHDRSFKTVTNVITPLFYKHSSQYIVPFLPYLRGTHPKFAFFVLFSMAIAIYHDWQNAIISTGISYDFEYQSTQIDLSRYAFDELLHRFRPMQDMLDAFSTTSHTASPVRALFASFSHMTASHLAGNFALLAIFGRKVYQALGPLLFGFLWWMSAYGGAQMNAHFQEYKGRTWHGTFLERLMLSQPDTYSPEEIMHFHDMFQRPAFGSSSAIMGVATAAALLFPRDKIRILLNLPLPMAVAMLIAGDAYAMGDTVTNGIDHSGHVGGAIGGAIATMLLWYFPLLGKFTPFIKYGTNLPLFDAFSSSSERIRARATDELYHRRLLDLWRKTSWKGYNRNRIFMQDASALNQMRFKTSYKAKIRREVKGLVNKIKYPIDVPTGGVFRSPRLYSREHQFSPQTKIKQQEQKRLQAQYEHTVTPIIYRYRGQKVTTSVPLGQPEAFINKSNLKGVKAVNKISQIHNRPEHSGLAYNALSNSRVIITPLDERLKEEDTQYVNDIKAVHMAPYHYDDHTESSRGNKGGSFLSRMLSEMRSSATPTTEPRPEMKPILEAHRASTPAKGTAAAAASASATTSEKKSKKNRWFSWVSWSGEEGRLQEEAARSIREQQAQLTREQFAKKQQLKPHEANLPVRKGLFGFFRKTKPTTPTPSATDISYFKKATPALVNSPTNPIISMNFTTTSFSDNYNPKGSWNAMHYDSTQVVKYIRNEKMAPTRTSQVMSARMKELRERQDILSNYNERREFMMKQKQLETQLLLQKMAKASKLTKKMPRIQKAM